MAVTLIIDNVVYILDDIQMLPSLAKKASPAITSMAAATSVHSAAPSLNAATAVPEPYADGYKKPMQESEQTSERPLRILFVEDNDYVRELTVCLFEGVGREVAAYASGEEALAAFGRETFDVVITDVSLPNMSGIDLAKQILKAAPDTWLIIVSGYQLPLGLEQLGPNVRSITKPFEADQVAALLSEVRAARLHN
jgi:two-component system, cell cycle response regulator CpdR